MKIEDIYNFDEIDFRIEIEKSQMIITEEITLSLYQTDADNRDYITSIKCVNDLDYAFSSMLILTERQHLNN